MALIDAIVDGGWYLVHGVVPEGVPEGARGWLGAVDATGNRLRMPLGRLQTARRCSVVVVLPAGCTEVAFVAVFSHAASQSLPQLRLRKLGCAKAFGLMVCQLRDGAGKLDPLRPLVSLLHITSPLLRGRIRDAGHALWSVHQARLGVGDILSEGVACLVRGRAMGVARAANWFPCHQLQARLVPPGRLEYETAGDDPRFVLQRTGRPLKLSAGWYRIECATSTAAGRLLAPALYPDYGNGYLPQDMVKLPKPDAAGVIRALVRFKAKVFSLRFDPSIELARFTIDAFTMDRVGALETLKLRLRRVRSSKSSRDSGGWYLIDCDAPDDMPEGAYGWLHVVDVGGNRLRMPMGRLHAGRSSTAVVVMPPGWMDVVVTADSDVASRVIGFDLCGISVVDAFARMLGQFRDGRGHLHPFGPLPSLVRILPALLRGHFRDAGDALWASYESRLRAGDDRPDGAGCLVRSRALGAGQLANWLPSHDLRACAIGHGQLAFEATGDDPQFRLEHAGRSLVLRAGWYRIECATSTEAGRLLAPALYPDYGEGCVPQQMLRLPEPDSDGSIRALVMFKAPVLSLRFDPSIQRVRFKMDASTLHQVSRLAALAWLLDRYRCSDGSRDWRALGAASLTFVADTARHGLSAAASRLHEGQDGGMSARTDYTNWVRLYDTHGSRDRRLWNERARTLENGPLISILLPVYQTPEHLLRKCLDSVMAQAYGRWELCAVDDASPSAHVSRVLLEYARRDSRIRFMRRDSNGHISAASNDALAMATGAYLALLDHDDELRPHALLEVAEQLVAGPDLGLVYSDEDKIDERGRRFQPYFKPDWNPDLLLSQNYLCHFSVIAAGIVRQAGGFRVGYEGSQDHDLFLRCVEQLQPEQIRHIPKVLYHWRAVSGSTALSRDAKDYASSAGARAIADHLTRVAPGARAEELEHGHYRVIWSLPSPPPKVSLIVPTRDRVELLRTCIDSVLDKTAYLDFEIIVVDNQSCEPETLAYFDAVGADDRIRVLAYDAPFNYSAINNWAAGHARGQVLCLLNNDIEVISARWLDELVSQALRPGIGAVGAMLYYPDRTIQHAGVILGMGGVANHIYAGAQARFPGHGARALVAQNLSAVTGACLVVRKALYEQMGGLDERLQVAFNDIDFCLRLREAGYRNVWTPFAELVHHESASRGRDESEEKRARFLGEVRYMESRWGDWLLCDPAYNPNLSLDALDSTLAFPPRAVAYPT